MKLYDLLPMLPNEGPPLPRFMMPQKVGEDAVPVPEEEESATPVLEGKLTTAQTIAYQNRELAKTLLSLEAHLSQGCRIDGQPCDCCSARHPLELEKLSEEAISMTSNPVYEDIIGFAREVEEKANENAVQSREYEDEYPKLAQRARDLRKQLARGKAELALDLIRQGGIPLGA